MKSLSIIAFILFNNFLKNNCFIFNDDINTHLMGKLNTSHAHTFTPTLLKAHKRNKRSIRQLEEDVDNDISKSKEDTRLFDPNISDLLHYKIGKQKGDESLKEIYNKKHHRNDNHNHNNNNHNNSLPNAQQKQLSHPNPLMTPNSIVNPNPIEKRNSFVPVYRETASGYPAMTMFGEESPVRIVYRDMDSAELLNDDNNSGENKNNDIYENNINNINNNIVGKNINDDIAKNINNDIFRNVDNSISSNIKPIDFQFTTEISNDFITHETKENRPENAGTTDPSVAQRFSDSVNHVNQVNHKPQSSYMNIVHHSDNNNNYNDNNRYRQPYNSPMDHQNRNNYQTMHYRVPNTQHINHYQPIYNAPNKINRYRAPEKLPTFSFTNQIKHKLLNEYRYDDNHIANDDSMNNVRREQRTQDIQFPHNPSFDRTLYSQTVSYPAGHHNAYFMTAERLNAHSSVSSTTLSPYDKFTREPIMSKQQQQQQKQHESNRRQNLISQRHSNRLSTRYWRPLLPEETYNIFSKVLQNKNKNQRILEPKLQIQAYTNDRQNDQQKYQQNVAQSPPKMDQIPASTQLEQQFGARISAKQRDKVRVDFSQQTTTSSSITTTTIRATMSPKLLRPTRRPSRNHYSQSAPSESKFFTIGATLKF